MMSNDEIFKIADHFRKNIKNIKPLSDESLDGYFYNHLSLCVIDAVWSIGVRYKGVQNVVNRYCNHRELEPYRGKTLRENLEYPGITQQESISAFLKYLEQFSFEELANNILKNRCRTSTKNGILKSEAVVQFTKILSNYEVDYFQDITKIVNNNSFKNDIKHIPGQTSGISLNYFLMLSGDENKIKNDRMIQRFLAEPIGRLPHTIGNDEALDAFQRLFAKLKDNRIGSIRHLDNIIWNYQRDQQISSKKK